MSIWTPQIWKTHSRKRHDLNECPHCGARLRWIYDGVEWLPCDHKPVLFIKHPEGRETVVYGKKIIKNVIIYKKGDPRFSGMPRQGSVQHYYTCPALIATRREYARNERRKEFCHESQ